MQKLKFVSILATGYNVVDVKAARDLGITVSNVPYYSTASVAQLTFAFILEFASRVAVHDESVHRGVWQNSKDLHTPSALCTSCTGKRSVSSVTEA